MKIDRAPAKKMLVDVQQRDFKEGRRAGRMITKRSGS